MVINIVSATHTPASSVTEYIFKISNIFILFISLYYISGAARETSIKHFKAKNKIHCTTLAFLKQV